MQSRLIRSTAEKMPRKVSARFRCRGQHLSAPSAWQTRSQHVKAAPNRRWVALTSLKGPLRPRAILARRRKQHCGRSTAALICIKPAV